MLFVMLMGELYNADSAKLTGSWIKIFKLLHACNVAMTRPTTSA